MFLLYDLKRTYWSVQCTWCSGTVLFSSWRRNNFFVSQKRFKSKIQQVSPFKTEPNNFPHFWSNFHKFSPILIQLSNNFSRRISHLYRSNLKSRALEQFLNPKPHSPWRIRYYYTWRIRYYMLEESGTILHGCKGWDNLPNLPFRSMP